MQKQSRKRVLYTVIAIALVCYVAAFIALQKRISITTVARTSEGVPSLKALTVVYYSTNRRVNESLYCFFWPLQYIAGVQGDVLEAELNSTEPDLAKVPADTLIFVRNFGQLSRLGL